jgi:hypothetical protein
VSNHRKADLVNDNFGIQSFHGSHGEISSRDRFMPKGQVCPEFPIQQPGQLPTVVTCKSLTIWSRKMDHRKSQRLASGWYSEFPEFQFILVSEIEFPPSCCSVQTDFSSVDDAQNSVTSKL